MDEFLFDTHAHYDDEAFDEDREALLASLGSHGIGAVTNIAAGMDSCRTTLALAERYSYVYAAIGVHPEHAAELNAEHLVWLKEQAFHEKVVAIGEIGLDYYWDEPDRNIQKSCFLQQLELAKEVKLPVIIHSRDAAKDTLDIMRADINPAGGVIHCFSYPRDMAREFLNLGFYLGIGGVVTFKNAAKVKEVVEYMPMDKLLLETDCPYLAPAPHRGKRNSSLNLPNIVEEISRIKGITANEVIEITCQNARRFYHIEDIVNTICQAALVK